MASAKIKKGDNVVVLSGKDKGKTGTVSKAMPKEGKVVFLGEGRMLKDGSRAAFQVKKDDRVIFSSYAGTEIKIEGEEFLIMSEDDVLAIVG